MVIAPLGADGGCMSQEEGRSPEAVRKEKQRKREAAMGIERGEIKQSWRERGMAEFCAYVRGGFAGPYDFNEYINTLVRRDYERLQAQLKQLEGATCEQCRNPLPQGCGGVHPDYATCWFTRGPLSLAL